MVLPRHDISFSGILDLSLKAKFVSQFFQELCKLESSNMISIWRINDCIVGLRHRVIALILFLFIFLSFPVLHITIKFFVTVFSGIVEARILKLGKHMDNELLYCGIENEDPLLIFFLLVVHFLSF